MLGYSADRWAFAKFRKRGVGLISQMVITLGTGRTTFLQGVVHLVLFAAFVLFSLVP